MTPTAVRATPTPATLDVALLARAVLAVPERDRTMPWPFESSDPDLAAAIAQELAAAIAREHAALAALDTTQEEMP